MNRVCLLVCCIALQGVLVACAPREPTVGIYRAVLQLPGGEAPFQLQLAKENTHLVMYLMNGAERTRVDDVKFDGKTMLVKFPGLENRLQATFDRSSLDGDVIMIRTRGVENKLPFLATRGDTYRFFPDATDNNGNVAGRWEVTFTEQDGKPYPAVAEFTQSGDQVTGTFLTSTGDHHFLSGQMRGDELFLSMFNGAHAFLYHAKLNTDGQLRGDYWSGIHSHETFVGKRNAEAKLPDEAVTKRDDTLSFSFPDLDGHTISLGDSRFRNKVVIVTLGGSWCGNCHDEAAFLEPFYHANHERGIEIIALMFERFGDFADAAAAARRFRDHFHIEYPMLIAGISDTDEASKLLPQLSHVYAFPTEVMLDRHGQIRRIHSGFSGPATGAHFDEYKKEFAAAVEQLLTEE